jgi:hypothetical protein
MALTTNDITRLKQQISASLQANAGISIASAIGILPTKDLQGKIYEAYILAFVIEKLVIVEGYSVQLVNNGTLVLKQKGSPINRTYPYFTVHKNGKLIGEIFTDTEFTSLSFKLRRGTTFIPGDFHELDIAMFKPGCSGRPGHDQILLAVECKATEIGKNTFREMLGFRREMTLLTNVNPTIFNTWPVRTVNSDPPSVHLCFSTDPAIIRYADNGRCYGIYVIHEPIN